MCACFSDKLPYPFDWIQFWTIWRQVVKPKVFAVSEKKGPIDRSMMISGIVQDDNCFSGLGAMTKKFFQEFFECHGVKRIRHHGDQFSGLKVHGSKHRNAFTCWRMFGHRVFLLWRNPHNATGTVLLEMAFVQTPYINTLVGGEPTEFFYMPFVRRGLPAQLRDGVFSFETPFA